MAYSEVFEVAKLTKNNYLTEIGINNVKENLCSIATSSSRRRHRYEENLCFGAPLGSGLWAILIGLVIVLWGVSEILGFDFSFWALVAIVFGLVILVNAFRRFPSRP